MHGWPVRGMLVWSTLEPDGGLVSVCLYPPPGNARSGDVALRSIVDTAVSSVQAKYAERADTVSDNLRRAEERERAVAEVRDAYFAVVDSSAADDQRMPMRDLWAQVEERVTSHDVHPTVEDANSVLGHSHVMKTYLTSRRGQHAEEIDAYDVATSINMTLSNQHSPESCRRTLTSLVDMAARMLVTRSDQPVRFLSPHDADASRAPDVQIAALALRHLDARTPLREKPLLEFVEGVALSATPDACAEHFPEMLHAHCVDPVSRTKLCSLLTMDVVDPVDTPFSDAPSPWHWSLLSTSVVIPSVAVSSSRRAAVSASMVDSMVTFITHRDPLESRTAREEGFVRGPTAHAAGGGSHAVTMLMAEHGVAHSSFRDGRERQIAADLSVSDPSASRSNDPFDGLQLAASASYTPPTDSPFPLFVLTPVPDSSPVDAVVELGTGGAWSAGETPSESLDALAALQAFLHHKYVS